MTPTNRQKWWFKKYKNIISNSQNNLKYLKYFKIIIFILQNQYTNTSTGEKHTSGQIELWVWR